MNRLPMIAFCGFSQLCGQAYGQVVDNVSWVSNSLIARRLRRLRKM